MIRYKGGFKYRLQDYYSIKIEICPVNPIETDYIHLSVDGDLLIRPGYCWDGASGPVPDTKSNMRAALIHDALYQLMRCRELDSAVYKKPADKIFMVICIDDGVPRLIAKGYYRGLKWFGKSATMPKNAKKVITAP